MWAKKLKIPMTCFIVTYSLLQVMEPNLEYYLSYFFSLISPYQKRIYIYKPTGSMRWKQAGFLSWPPVYSYPVYFPMFTGFWQRDKSIFVSSTGTGVICYCDIIHLTSYQFNSLLYLKSLKKGKATPSSILAWRISSAEKPGRLQSMGLQGAEHDWEINTHTHI